MEVWLSPSDITPALGSVDSSLGSGKIRSSVIVWAVGCLALFVSACGSDRTLEFLHYEGISSGPQVVLIVGHSAGAAAPSLFHACACGISLCGLLEEVFCSVCLSSACGFLFTAFLDSWLRLLSS